MKTTCKQIGMILLVSGFLAFIANAIHPRKIPWVQVRSGPVEAKAKKEGISIIPLSLALKKFQSLEAVFVDARAETEFAKGHIPGSLSIPFQTLEENFPGIGNLLDADRELIVYCRNRSCDDALLLAIELKAMGAENLYLFIDGFEGWSLYGGAVEP